MISGIFKNGYFQNFLGPFISACAEVRFTNRSDLEKAKQELTRAQCYKTFCIRNSCYLLAGMFATLKPLQPSLMFMGKVKSQSYSQNIRLDWKSLRGTNTLAYYEHL